MENNLNALDVAKELVRIDDNIDLIAKNHNGLIDCLNKNSDIIDQNFDDLEKLTKSLSTKTAIQGILIIGIIGYLVYKEVKKKDEQ